MNNGRLRVFEALRKTTLKPANTANAQNFPGVSPIWEECHRILETEKFAMAFGLRAASNYSLILEAF